VSPTKIMLIRHAEKPIPDGANGIDADGQPDPESLSAIGWERAKKLVGFFTQATAAHINKPDFAFAAAPEVGSKRPAETVTLLLKELWPEDGGASHFNQAIRKELVTEVAPAIMATNGVVLVCWEHTLIHALVDALPNAPATPVKWPGPRFDVVWVLKPKPGGWDFHQTPQMLLPADEDSVIPF
jgi:hypothetical protein